MDIYETSNTFDIIDHESGAELSICVALGNISFSLFDNADAMISIVISPEHARRIGKALLRWTAPGRQTIGLDGKPIVIKNVETENP